MSFKLQVSAERPEYGEAKSSEKPIKWEKGVIGTKTKSDLVRPHPALLPPGEGAAIWCPPILLASFHAFSCGTFPAPGRGTIVQIGSHLPTSAHIFGKIFYGAGEGFGGTPNPRPRRSRSPQTGKFSGLPAILEKFLRARMGRMGWAASSGLGSCSRCPGALPQAGMVRPVGAGGYGRNSEKPV